MHGSLSSILFDFWPHVHTHKNVFLEYTRKMGPLFVRQTPIQTDSPWCNTTCIYTSLKFENPS